MLGRCLQPLCPVKVQCTLHTLQTSCWNQHLAYQGAILLLLPALHPTVCALWISESENCSGTRICRSSSGLPPCCLLEGFPWQNGLRETLRKEEAQILLPSMGLCSLTCPVTKTWHFWPIW